MGRKYAWILVGAILASTAFFAQKIQLGQYIDTMKEQNISWENDAALQQGQVETAAPDIQTEKRVYLTFDDGPSDLTEQYLDILKKHQIQATFFVIGNQVEEHPEIIRREIAEGHEIGIHTYSHESSQIYQSADAYDQDVRKVEDILEGRFGVTPRYWRFPWGSANCYICSYRNDIIARLRGRKLDYVDWNVSAEDSVGCPSVSSIMENVQKDCFRVAEPVVLMHDSGSNRATLDSLESIVGLFEEQGYQFGKISERKETCHFGEY